MRRASPLLLFLVLAACGTPQERCIDRETRDLRTLTGLISESEDNLRRGYALEEVTVYRDHWEQCQAPPPPPMVGPDGQLVQLPPPPPQLCLRERAETETRPKSIDLRAEARKLAGMKEKKVALMKDAESAIALCKLQYPDKK